MFSRLYEFTFATMALRLVMAMCVGAAIGAERERKGYAAGFRTYMLVCVGAALTMLLGHYQVAMLQTHWSDIMGETGIRIDVSRYSAQVINGIGFLGAGAIIVNRKQEVKGLTTAASLWASGCLGIAVGAGFYECALFGILFIIISNYFFPYISDLVIKHSTNMNIFVEYSRVADIREISNHIRSLGIDIYDADIMWEDRSTGEKPSAIILMKLPASLDHESAISAIADLDCINLIDEI